MARRAGTKDTSRFITFEGPEGSGKSTHIRRLARFLRRRGIRCLVTREPGGTPVGEAIRKILLRRGNVRIDPLTELFLYMAARTALVGERIRPAIARGIWVLSDRYLDASLCYQGYGHGVDLGLIRRLGAKATGGLKPDLTFLLDVDARKGLARVRRAKTWFDRIEAKPIAFHRRVRRGYLELARREPRRIRVISADGSKDRVEKRIQREVTRFLP